MAIYDRVFQLKWVTFLNVLIGMLAQNGHGNGASGTQ
jgi:hypothetical protein